MADILNTLGNAIGDAGKQALSEAAYQAYLKQIDKIRSQVTGNPPLGTEGVADKQTSLYYLKVKALSTAYIGVEQVVKNRQEKRIDKEYKDLEKTSLDNQEAAQKTKNNLDKDYKNALTNNNDLGISAKEAGELEQQIIQDNINEYYKALDTYSEKNTSSGLPRISNEEDVVKKNNPNTYTTNYSYLPLPEIQDKKVPAHEVEIGDFFANKVRFSIGTPQGKVILVKGWINPNGSPKQGTYGTKKQPLSEKVAAALESARTNLPGSYKFFIEKLHGKSTSTGEFYKKNPITPGKTAADYMNRMVFPAYVSSFSDSFSPSWSEYKFIGRSEPVVVYEQTTREFTIEFYMLADYSVDLLLAAIEEAKKYENKQTNTLDTTKDKLKNTTFKVKNKYTKENGEQEPTEEDLLGAVKKLGPDWGTGTSPDPTYIGTSKAGFVPGYISGTPEMLWERATFLAQCCYPYYRKDGKLKEQPFIRLRLGDYYDIVGVITSLNFSELDEFQLDLNPSAVGEIPMGLKVAMNIKVVHEDEPHYKYRRFYHRKDYDSNGIDYLPDSSRETSITKDATLDKSRTGSPLFNISPLDLQTDKMPMEVRAFQESLGSFNSSLIKLSASQGPQGLNDIKKREKLKESLINAKRLLDVSKELEAQEIKNLRPDDEEETSLAPAPNLPNLAAKNNTGEKNNPIKMPNKKLFKGI
jgi:hypothetical protein